MASRIAFSTGKPVKLRVHGRNRFVTLRSLDEGEIADVANHLYGSDGIARLQNGSDFDVAYEIAVDRTTRLRFRLNATPTRTARHFGVNIVLRPIADLPASLAEQSVEHEPRQLEHQHVRARRSESGRIDAAECAVHRWQQVERAEQGEHDQRRTASGATVGVRVEPHDHVRQAHGAEEGRDDDRVRRVERVRAQP